MISPTSKRFAGKRLSFSCMLDDKLLVFGFCDNSVREKDRRCRAQVTPARSPCVPRLRQRACQGSPMVDECPCAFYQRPRAAAIATRAVSLAVASRLPFLVIKRGGYSTETVCVHVLNGLVLHGESLRRDRPGVLMSPAFHACGSSSPFRSRCCHNSLNGR